MTIKSLQEKYNKRMAERTKKARKVVPLVISHAESGTSDRANFIREKRRSKI